MRRFIILAAFAVPTASFAQELVVNGGFEASPTVMTGWTVTNLGAFSGINAGGGSAHSGTNWFGFGATSQATQTDFSQVIATTVGQAYTVSYWGFDRDTASPGGWDVTFGGTSIGTRPPTGTYQQFSGVVVATSTATTLRVTGWEQVLWIIADDFSVQAVPEPATMAVLGIGALALVRRRRVRK